MDDRDVLAYSCAAARDLHPLPIEPAFRGPQQARFWLDGVVAGLRSCANLVYNSRVEKEQEVQLENLPIETNEVKHAPSILNPLALGPVLEDWKIGAAHAGNVCFSEARDAFERGLQLAMELRHLCAICV